MPVSTLICMPVVAAENPLSGTMLDINIWNFIWSAVNIMLRLLNRARQLLLFTADDLGLTIVLPTCIQDIEMKEKHSYTV